MRRTYNEIREMIGSSLLSTRTARDIIRKSMLRPGPGDVAGGALLGVNLAGQYAWVEGGSEFGSIIDYPADPEMGFPEQQIDPAGDESGRLKRFGDFRGVEELRLLVRVTRAAAANVTLSIRINQDVDGSLSPVSFTGTTPTIPLDEVALHVSEWKHIEWLADPDPERPAQVQWFIDNPTGSAGTVGIGLCQLQVKYL